MNYASISSGLRKGISVTFVVACVLLAALAVRSYWWRDSLVTSLPIENSLAIQSSAGQVLVGVFPERHAWRVESQPAAPQAQSLAQTAKERETPHIDSTPFRLGTIVVLPHWYLAFVLGTCAAVPWIRWRFGLRTLAAGVAV